MQQTGKKKRRRKKANKVFVSMLDLDQVRDVPPSSLLGEAGGPTRLPAVPAQ